jgi:hypothetical protein
MISFLAARDCFDYRPSAPVYFTSASSSRHGLKCKADFRQIGDVNEVESGKKIDLQAETLNVFTFWF